jgi:transcriptional regulator with XRE-family HTH domain
MDTGTKIRVLRESRKMSQEALAMQLGISQSNLCNIESGIPEKIDFLLIKKVCDLFQKDPSYFYGDNVINNRIKENKGQISCENFTVNNHYSESAFTEIQNLITENKQLKIEIAQLRDKKVANCVRKTTE